MTDAITFQLGPLPVRVEGDHCVVRWARRTYEALACDAEPAVTFSFVDDSVDISGPTVVGESKRKAGPDGIFFRAKAFDVRMRRTGDRFEVDLRQRDRRSRFVRSVVDPEEAWKMWLSHCGSLDVHLLKQFAYTICPFVMQCALLQRQAAIVHASGFELDGRGVLLPAWGGVGKSTVVSQAVLHGRARFIADDHAVIGADGRMHLHTLPIHAYAYHAQQDPVLRKHLMAAFSCANRWQWRFANVVRRKRAVRWVSPTDLFGADKLARQAKIEQVVVMFRAGRDDFLFEPVEAAEAARTCVALIVGEIKDFVGPLVLAGSGWTGSILPDLPDAYAQMTAVCEAAFSQARCARLLVPHNVGADELIEYLKERVPLLAQAAE